MADSRRVNFGAELRRSGRAGAGAGESTEAEAAAGGSVPTGE